MFFCNHVLGVTHTLHTLDTYIYKYDIIQSKKDSKENEPLKCHKKLQMPVHPGKVFGLRGPHVYASGPKTAAVFLRFCFCVPSATQWIAWVQTVHMPKPVITFVFNVLRKGPKTALITDGAHCASLQP